MNRLELTRYRSVAEAIKFIETPVPPIGAGDVLIEVAAASINPIDTKILTGELKRVQKLNLPAAIGFDCAGTIAAVGRNVSAFAVGDAVYSRAPRERMGSFAEFVAIDSQYVAKMPAKLTMVEAASIPLVGLTTVQALVDRAQARAGQRILIHAGSGGLGTFAIQYAKHVLGLHVTTTTSSANAVWVGELGADIVIPYDCKDYRESPARYDIVFDLLGGRTTFESFDVLHEGGTVVSVAGPPDRQFASSVRAGPLAATVIWAMGFSVRRHAKGKRAKYFRFLTESSGHQLGALTPLLEAGTIRPVIDRVYPFAKALEGLEYAVTGRAKGKTVLQMKD